MSAASTAPASAAARSAGGDAPAAPDWKWQIGKAVFFYAAFQGVAGPNGLLAWYQGKTTPRSPPAVKGGGDTTPTPGSTSSTQTPFSVPEAVVPRFAANSSTSALYPPGTPLDFYIFITHEAPPSEDDLSTQYSALVPGITGPRAARDVDFDNLDYAGLLQDPVRDAVNQAKIWKPTAKTGNVIAGVRIINVTLNDPALSRHLDLTLDVPHEVQSQNHSLWADVYAAPTGTALSKGASFTKIRKLLTLLYPQRKEREVKKLFNSKAEEAKEETEKTPETKKKGGVLPFLEREAMPIITYWHPNLTLAIVNQDAKTGYPIGKLPPPVLQWVHVVEDDEGEVVMPKGNNMAINYPVIFANDFWKLREHMYPLNSTITTLPLHIDLYSMSFFKFQMLSAVSDSFGKQPGMASGELDILKRTLMETAPWYLILTIAVSILHSLFEFIAFSADVSSWRKKDNMVGVSLGSIMTNIFVQIIIMLYLLDQSHETSWMILSSQGISIVIEAWKLTKAVVVSVVPRKRGEGYKWLQWSPYRVIISDKHVLSEEEKKTQEYDKLAFKIVACFAGPLLGGYTIYSALYQEHKGTWSFIIGTLSSFVYTFGIVSLVPQLIVNYKLKSTAGMNAKVFVFKLLNTFVDDLFAFAIPMPTWHRVSAFKDDLVFLIFLYQRWIYGVDNKRANEFGQVVDDSRAPIEESKKTQ